MRCYTGQHQFYAGIDLHARTMYTHVLDQKGKTVFEKVWCCSARPRADTAREPSRCCDESESGPGRLTHNNATRRS